MREDDSVDLLTRAVDAGLLDESSTRKILSGKPATSEWLIALGLLSVKQVKSLQSKDPAAPRDRAQIPPDAEEAMADPKNHFGPYVRINEIGRGGFGSVWRAWDTKLFRTVALKIMHGGQEADIARFKREARLAATLVHPNIAAIYDVGEVNQQHYIALQFIEGETLAKLRLGPREALAAVREAARALAHAHARNIIHRDMKPQNVMRDRAGRIFVLDFGLARSMGPGQSITASNVAMGTPSYMSPEQVMAGTVNTVSDVYGLGATLYEALTGRPPFVGETAIKIMRRVLDQDPPAPRKLNPMIERDAETVCLKALEKEPERRYASAAAFADDLDCALSGEPIVAHPPSTWYRLRKRIAKRKALTAVSLTAVVVIAVILGVLLPKLGAAHESLLAEVRRNAEVSLRGVLTARRAGDIEAMGSFLPPLKEACERAADAAPEHPEPNYHMGRMYRAMMQFDEAAAQQEVALKKEPHFGPSLYERAVLLSRRYRLRREVLERDALAEAGAKLARSGVLQSGGLEGIVISAPSGAELESRDATLADLKRRIVADITMMKGAEGVDAAHVSCAEGLLHVYGDDPERAIELLTSALSRDKYLEEAYEALTDTALNQRDFSRAIEWSTKGHDLDRGYRPHLRNRAKARARWATTRRNLNGRDPAELFQSAVEDYEPVLKQAPGLVEGWVSLGDIRHNWGNLTQTLGRDPKPLYDAAIENYDRALSLDSKFALAYGRRGSCSSNLGFYVMYRGEDPAPHFESALEDFRISLELNPSDGEILVSSAVAGLNWGTYLLDHGRDPTALYKAAENSCTEAIKIDPTHLEALSTRAMIRTSLSTYQSSESESPQHYFNEALADYAAVLEQDPAHTESLIGRGQLRSNRGVQLSEFGRDPTAVLKAALDDFSAATKIDPENLEAWLGAGDVRLNWGYFLLGRGKDPRSMYRKSIECLDRVIDASPGHPRALLRRAKVRLNWGLYLTQNGMDSEEILKRSLEDFDALLKIDPKSAEGWLGRAATQLSQGMFAQMSGRDPSTFYKEAVDNFTEALDLNRSALKAWIGRGNARMNLGMFRQVKGGDSITLYKAATLDYDAALRLDANSPEALLRRADAHVNHALALRQRGKPFRSLADKSILDYDRSLKLNPTNPEAYYRRGICHHLLKQWARADDDFSKAAKLSPAAVPLFRRFWNDAKRLRDDF